MGPILGLVFHWIGGFASASFYVPYRGVKAWSWEVLWLTGGVISWVVAPWAFAAVQTVDLVGVLMATPGETLFWCYAFGVAWGFGGLTFGLALRYLGLSLGMAVALGLTTVFGTLMPPLWEGTLAPLLAQTGGRVVLLGVLVTVLGIVIVGIAGRKKEAELPVGERRKAVAEYDFKKGLGVAIFSGVMSAAFAYGLAAGAPIRALTLAAGTAPLQQGLPVLVVILAGGFTTNALWCLYLILKNRSMRQFAGFAAADGPDTAGRLTGHRLLMNYGLCALAGLSWYLQFFFYTMGESQMGEEYAFSSWTLHMASIIIFSTLWGVFFKEWRGVSRGTTALVWLGIGSLVIATAIIGLGNKLS